MTHTQHEALATKIFESIDHVLDMETNEGLQVYKAILSTLSKFYHDHMKQDFSIIGRPLGREE